MLSVRREDTGPGCFSSSPGLGDRTDLLLVNPLRKQEGAGARGPPGADRPTRRLSRERECRWITSSIISLSDPAPAAGRSRRGSPRRGAASSCSKPGETLGGSQAPTIISLAATAYPTI